MDLILKRARLQDGSVVDVGMADGVITAIGAPLEATTEAVAKEKIDVGGRLTLPAFVNGQLHACKSFWRRLLRTLPHAEKHWVQRLPRFEAARHVKRLYTAENVFERVDEVMQMAIASGTCAIRLFADVDADAGLRALQGLLRIREKYRTLLAVQVVAFPQDGLATEAERALLRQAMELGADVVGGIPFVEGPSRDARRVQHVHVKECFELARIFDADLHFVCDDVLDPSCRTLEMVARQTLAQGWQGRVSATQCAALAAYPDDYAGQVIELVADAGITVFCNSHVSLIATEFDDERQPWPRGITRVRQLMKAGVPVACAQDDVDNWFYPFGRNDMLEVAQFMAHNGHFAWQGEVDQVLPMVTRVPATTLGLQDYGLEPGAVANLVVLDAEDWHDAVQFQVDRRHVILKGKVAAQTVRRVDLRTAT